MPDRDSCALNLHNAALSSIVMKINPLQNKLKPEGCILLDENTAPEQTDLFDQKLPVPQFSMSKPGR